MDMIFCPLYSGSSGNALFVQYGSTRLLIDAGKSGKMIDEALDMIGVDPRTLDALLITHEHSDHICGAGVLSRKYKLPIYATSGTWEAMDGKLGKIAGSQMLDGSLVAKEKFRILRNRQQVWDGKVQTLRHFKDEVALVEINYQVLALA